MSKLQTEEIIKAGRALKGVIQKTPLQKNEILSERYECNVFLKREDLQVVRSFKIRGAYNSIQSIPEETLKNGVVCASAGNHAQGVAYSCKALNIPGTIFMPATTPRQKVGQVNRFGGQFVEVVLTGDTFDDSFLAAKAYCEKENKVFIHPFDDYKIIAGQGTIGMEIMDDAQEEIDFVFCTIGGGGLIAGVGSYIKNISPNTKIIGVEPLGACSMKKSLEEKQVITLETIDKFVDGAAVKRVGELTFGICKKVIDDIVAVPEGKVCTSILELYNENAIVVEPAGALPVAALDFYKEQIKGKNVVCIISGGNNDIERMQEIKERSLLYEGLKHYFIINFPQRPGALKEFVVEVLGPRDDITRFEYTKVNNKEEGPTLVGIELNKKEDYDLLIERMKQKGIRYTVINESPELFNLLI
ncbi:threonine ammonia-lyase IlvA [Thermanaerosceptrum fracticalcis]|uniref:L-threonine dehydratase n=1 Tax=Thermanaerosceptrum fracticalcis TaxID=1712410 RepID=A0A7G6E4W5_THEFR|nr:threonine ammonia-lyase IlvA [Thermanaerosceptrum fracticalcis]QNB47119.1 threonine ammonia-lyase IlvA [Thermanaerosceptrum fracticalcis]